MELYRLAHANFSDLTGNGGMYGSARWHNQGHPILYTASSRSLAALERFVHESAATLPKLKMLTIWVPDNFTIVRYTDKQLPADWDLLPESQVSRDFGDKWLREGKYAGMQVPSAIVREEYNLLINPFHPDSKRIKSVDEIDFYYDPRLQKMIR